MPLEDPQELFHYTSISGLKGILESQTLWATHYKYLNDKEEIIHFQPRMKKLISSILKQINRDRQIRLSPKDLKKIAVCITKGNALLLGDEANLPLAEPYVASFCRAGNKNIKKHGLLSQWRGYGQGGGCAIVFDAPVLKNLVGEEGNNWSYSFLHGGDVVYSDASEKEIQQEIGHHLKTLKQGFAEFLATLQSEPNPEPPEKTYSPLLAAACRYKHWGFKEEKEFRIVAVPSSSEAVNELRRQRGDSVKEKPKEHFMRSCTAVPYINLFEGLTYSPAKRLPIRRILIGPHPEKEKRKTEIQILLNQLGIRAEVSMSEIPYLGQ